MHALAASLYAVNWSPEIRGIIVVLIGIGVLIGGTYIILGTNIGARVGFLVAMAALFGWMATMGAVWFSYGIGLKGRDPTWRPMETILDFKQANHPNLVGSGAFADPIAGATNTGRVDGWVKLKEDNPSRGQAVASADEILTVEEKILKSGDYLPVAVYDKGGKSSPKFTTPKIWKFGSFKFDMLAVFHDPHYAVVEVAPVIKQNTEPGKAPPKAVIDPKAPHYFVLMIRDLGTRRQPAAAITSGSAVMFALLAYMLHTRDRRVTLNRSVAIEPAGAGA